MPRTVIDYRLGGLPIWRIVPDDWEGFVRIPNEVLKCVVFIGRKVMDPKTRRVETKFGGTGFFVGVPSGVGANLICLVTARHVAEEIEHGEFCIRINTQDGQSKTLWLDGGYSLTWMFHPTDQTVDVAVAIWAPPDEDADFKYLPTHMLLSAEMVDRKHIGVGDETYIVGLFRRIAGKSRNSPIIRVGHIAMMPDDRVPVKWHADGIEGYLVEARSTGGLSGSPVFVQRSVKVRKAEVSGREPLAAGPIFLLGLIHGHWDVKASEIDTVTDTADGDQEAINSGVAVAVPCHKILEVLDRSEVRKAVEDAKEISDSENAAQMDGGTLKPVMKRGEEMKAARSLTANVTMMLTSGVSDGVPDAAEPDAGFPKGEVQAEPKADNPSHREDFMSLVGAAAKKKPPSE